MYKLFKSGMTNETVILRLVDNACIPFDEANTDYQAYLAWCEAGNSPYPADSATPEPADEE
jgi:hypothetical protein